jgi:hypothetical protein
MKTIFALTLALFISTTAFANPALHGTWSVAVQGKPLKVEFAPDGTGKLNEVPMRWQSLGGALFIQPQGGQVYTYGFKLDGDKLNVSGGDLAQPVTLSKGAAAYDAAMKEQKKQQQKQAAAQPGTKAGPVASGNGQELVGKWCDVRSMSNYSGGSSSMACFEIKADGTYTYNAESSRSVSAGSTASQSSDAGRWSYNGTQLVAQSRNGQSYTYNLEKRNHPKNQRDPMICLNGACYVTFYNKAAW